MRLAQPQLAQLASIGSCTGGNWLQPELQPQNPLPKISEAPPPPPPPQQQQQQQTG